MLVQHLNSSGKKFFIHYAISEEILRKNPKKRRLWKEINKNLNRNYS